MSYRLETESGLFKAYRKSFFRNVLIRSEEIRSGTKVEIRTVLDPDYSDLEVVSTYDNFKYSVTGENKITFTMPQRNITLVLRAYKRHKITFDYNLDDYGFIRHLLHRKAGCNSTRGSVCAWLRI